MDRIPDKVLCVVGHSDRHSCCAGRLALLNQWSGTNLPIHVLILHRSNRHHPHIMHMAQRNAPDSGSNGRHVLHLIRASLLDESQLIRL